MAKVSAIPIKDAITFHGMCSMITGLEVAADAIRLQREPGLDSAQRVLVRVENLKRLSRGETPDFDLQARVDQGGVATNVYGQTAGDTLSDTDLTRVLKRAIAKIDKDSAQLKADLVLHVSTAGAAVVSLTTPPMTAITTSSQIKALPTGFGVTSGAAVKALQDGCDGPVGVLHTETSEALAKLDLAEREQRAEITATVERLQRKAAKFSGEIRWQQEEITAAKTRAEQIINSVKEKKAFESEAQAKTLINVIQGIGVNRKPFFILTTT